jgi:hypothetical protein
MTEVFTDVAVGERLSKITNNTAGRSEKVLGAVGVSIHNSEKLEDGVQVLGKQLSWRC